MALSSNVIQHKNALASSDEILLLLEINIPSLVDPIYITNNNEDVTWNGENWISFGFTIDEISEDADNSVPEVNLMLPNANRAMEQYIIEYDLWLKQNPHQSIDTTLYIVSSADIANPVPIQSYSYEISKYSSNSQWVTFTLTFDNLFIKRFPKNRITRNSCRWKFGSTECGYTILGSETCNKTLTACRGFNNSGRFGAFPSVGGKLDKVYL